MRPSTTYTPALPATYDTEFRWNYELGLRSQWFDGAVVSQITLFYLDRKDTQVRGSSGSGITFSYFTVNGESAEHFGAEAEATWFINDQFTLNLAGGLLQTDRDAFSVSGAPTVSYKSGDVSNAPDFTYSARLDYDADNGIFAIAEVVGSDQYYESDDPVNRSKSQRGAYTVVNASIGYRYENWTFTIWSKNLFDEEYEDRVFFFDNGAGEQRYEGPAAPRTFGVTANYSW